MNYVFRFNIFLTKIMAKTDRSKEKKGKEKSIDKDAKQNRTEQSVV